MKLLLVHNLKGLLDNYIFRLKLKGLQCEGAGDWNHCISSCNINRYDLVLISSELPEFPPELLAVYLRFVLPEDDVPRRIALLGSLPDGCSRDALQRLGIVGTVPLSEDVGRFIADCREVTRKSPPAVSKDDPHVRPMIRASTAVLSALRAKRHFRAEFNSVNDEHKELLKAFDMMHRHMSEQSEAALISLTIAAEIRDPYLRGHNKWVSRVAYEIGRRLNFDESLLENIVKGALLHDVGKIGIPDSILNKRDALSEDERRAIQSHPLLGVRILETNPVFDPYLDIVRYHHERLDGSGYPDGLRGDDIPLSAQIVAVADVFSALTTSRAYREAVSPSKAMEDIYPLRGIKLNADAVDALGDYVASLEGGLVPVVFSFDDVSLPEILRHLTLDDV